MAGTITVGQILKQSYATLATITDTGVIKLAPIMAATSADKPAFFGDVLISFDCYSTIPATDLFLASNSGNDAFIDAVDNLEALEALQQDLSVLGGNSG